MSAALKVKVKKLNPAATIPTKATDGSAAFDLHAASLDFAHGGVLIGTGLSFEVPKGHVMLVYSRSGQGFNHGVTLANGTGVIDSDYRGEVMVKLRGTPASSSYLSSLKVGDRIAQAIIQKLPALDFVEVDKLSETVRGDKGLGSTGK